jgi:hypothetical protein
MVAADPPHCNLVMNYIGQEYFASLYFDDAEFFDKFCKRLQGLIGLPIAVIASLDIP